METPQSFLITFIFGSGLIALATFFLTWRFIRTKSANEAEQSILLTESANLTNDNAMREALDKLLGQLSDYAQRIADLTEQNVKDRRNCQKEKQRLQEIIDSLEKSEKKL